MPKPEAVILAQELRTLLQDLHARKAALEEEGYVLTFHDVNSLPTALPASAKIAKIEEL